MRELQLLHLTSLVEVRAAAPAWDDLWWRSEVTMPAARAELVAQWVEQFAPRADFHALVVEDQGKWIAALPLVGRAVAHVLRAGTVPANAWVQRGGLLLDAGVETDAALDLLVAATRDLPWHLLWMDEVPLHSPSWKAFRRAVARAGMASALHDRYEVGRVEIDHNWEAYRGRWSRGHRRRMVGAARQFAKAGGVTFEVNSLVKPEEVELWLRDGFDVEDRSWKGEAGSSVFRRGMFDFFVRQARTLARWGQLELAFLKCGDRSVAFSYGMNAKGVYHMLKTAYDPEYASCSPGQFLVYNMLETLHREPRRRALDFLGEMEWQRRWKPATYKIGEVLVAPRRLLGSAALYAYRDCWPLIRRLKKRLRTSPVR